VWVAGIDGGQNLGDVGHEFSVPNRRSAVTSSSAPFSRRGGPSGSCTDDRRVEKRPA
jgi:hypothetical protein